MLILCSLDENLLTVLFTHLEKMPLDIVHHLILFRIKRSYHGLSVADQAQDTTESEEPHVTTQCAENPKSVGEFLRESNFSKHEIRGRPLSVERTTGIRKKKKRKRM